MKQLTPQQSKAAALGILLLVVVLGISIVALPVWLLNRHYDTAIDDASSVLGKFARLKGMQDGLMKQALEVKALEANHHFLKTGSAELAAGELREQAQAIFDASGAKVNSIQNLPAKDDGVYRQVTVSVQLLAPLSAVKSMTYALETAHPYLFLDNFRITATNMVINRPEPATEPDLVVQFDLSGYALKGAK